VVVHQQVDPVNHQLPFRFRQTFWTRIPARCLRLGKTCPQGKNCQKCKKPRFYTHKEPLCISEQTSRKPLLRADWAAAVIVTESASRAENSTKISVRLNMNIENPILKAAVAFICV
jgi:hypothetical protein